MPHFDHHSVDRQPLRSCAWGARVVLGYTHCVGALWYHNFLGWASFLLASWDILVLMTVSMDDLLYLRRHLNTSHSCICVGSDLTPATVAGTSSASHLHSPAVFTHTSMFILSAQSSHVELVLFVPLCTDSVPISTTGSACIAPSGAGIISISTCNCYRIWETEGESHELTVLTKTPFCPPHLSSFQELGGRVSMCRAASHAAVLLTTGRRPDLDHPQHSESLGSHQSRLDWSSTRIVLGTLSCVAMRLQSTMSSLASRRIFGWGTLRCNASCLLSSALPSTLLDSWAHL